MRDRLGPQDDGRIPFTLDGAPFALDVPADGLAVCAWAASGAWMKLVPGCVADDCRDEFEELLADPSGPYGLRACWRIALGLAEQVYGVPGWTAERLAATAEENWIKFSAWTVRSGFDPTTAPAHRVMSAVLGWLYEGVGEEKDARKLEQQLFTPPKPSRRGAKNAPGFTPADQAAAWQNAFAALGGGD